MKWGSKTKILSDQQKYYHRPEAGGPPPPSVQNICFLIREGESEEMYLFLYIPDRDQQKYYALPEAGGPPPSVQNIFVLIRRGNLKKCICFYTFRAGIKNKILSDQKKDITTRQRPEALPRYPSRIYFFC